MKKITFYLILALLTFKVVAAQEFINIGSTKEEVKKVQGEPSSIQNFESIDKEIWGYGENNEARIEFVSGKVKSYNNFNNILKIGKKKHDDNDTLTTTEKLIKAAADSEVRNKYKGGNVTNEAGLDAGGSIQTKSIPKEYQEMADAKGLSPFDLPDDDTLQKMQQDYEREKNITLIIYVFSGIILLFVGYKLGRRFLLNKK